MYRKWYPPAKYVFYPFYRRLRKGVGVSSALAYWVVWIISAFLHGALLLLFGNPIPAAVFALIFLSLGSLGAGVIAIKNRRRLRGSRHQDPSRVPNQAVQRTGASRCAQSETGTSSAAGSRR